MNPDTTWLDNRYRQLLLAVCAEISGWPVEEFDLRPVDGGVEVSHTYGDATRRFRVGNEDGAEDLVEWLMLES